MLGSHRRRLPASWVAVLAVAAFAVAADQTTKALVRARIDLGDSVEGAGPFSIHHVRNSGVVGGHLQGSASLMAALTLVVIGGMLFAFARHGGTRPIVGVAFGLLFGGSLGNLVDRLRLGYVTDFIDRSSGGAFNVADLSILLGVALVLLAWVLGSRPSWIRAASRP